jgi:hypothetical protein
MEKLKYVPPINCVKCGKLIEDLNYPGPTLNDNAEDLYGMVKDGVVGKLYAPYGSCYDGSIFQIGICDPCIKEAKLVELGDYLESNPPKKSKKCH